MEQGADVNARNAVGRTAVHLCCERNTAGVLEVLLNTGKVDVNATTASGASALHFACRANAKECVSYSYYMAAILPPTELLL